MAPVLLGALKLWAMFSDEMDGGRAIGIGAIEAMIFLFGVEIGMMFIACLWAQFRYGIRDYRVSTIVCYYAAPLMWPLVVVFLAMNLAMMHPIASRLAEFHFHLRWATVDGQDCVMVGLLIMIGIAALYAWSRLCRGLRDVRFANV